MGSGLLVVELFTFGLVEVKLSRRERSGVMTSTAISGVREVAACESCIIVFLHRLLIFPHILKFDDLS